MKEGRHYGRKFSGMGPGEEVFEAPEGGLLIGGLSEVGGFAGVLFVVVEFAGKDRAGLVVAPFGVSVVGSRFFRQD